MNNFFLGAAIAFFVSAFVGSMNEKVKQVDIPVPTALCSVHHEMQNPRWPEHGPKFIKLPPNKIHLRIRDSKYGENYIEEPFNLMCYTTHEETGLLEVSGFNWDKGVIETHGQYIKSVTRSDLGRYVIEFTRDTPTCTCTVIGGSD